MRHHKPSHTQFQKPAAPALQVGTAQLDSNELAFTPSPNEVARRAYFAYVNEGSPQGHEVQHWLAAESELIAERNRTRTHGLQNQN